MRARTLVLTLSAALVAFSAFLACGGDDAATTPTPTTDAAPADQASPPAADTGPKTPVDAAIPPLLYSETFESYAAGPVANNAALGPWLASLSGVTMTVDGTQSFSGTKALRVTTTLPDGGPSHGTLHGATDAGIIPGNDLFGRVMVYYSSATGFGLPLNVHSWLFSTTGPSWEDGTKSVNTNLGGGGTKLQLNHHFIDGGERSAQGGTITAGAWHCVQWELDGSGSPAHDESRVWLDGAQVIDAKAPTYEWPSAVPWKTFDFGFNHYQGLAQDDFVDVWIDDFALDSRSIACPTK